MTGNSRSTKYTDFMGYHIILSIILYCIPSHIVPIYIIQYIYIWVNIQFILFFHYSLQWRGWSKKKKNRVVTSCFHIHWPWYTAPSVNHYIYIYIIIYLLQNNDYAFIKNVRNRSPGSTSSLFFSLVFEYILYIILCKHDLRSMSGSPETLFVRV